MTEKTSGHHHWRVEPHPNGIYKVVDDDTGVHLRKHFFAASAAQAYVDMQNAKEK